MAFSDVLLELHFTEIGAVERPDERRFAAQRRDETQLEQDDVDDVLVARLFDEITQSPRFSQHFIQRISAHQHIAEQMIAGITRKDQIAIFLARPQAIHQIATIFTIMATVGVDHIAEQQTEFRAQ